MYCAVDLSRVTLVEVDWMVACSACVAIKPVGRAQTTGPAFAAVADARGDVTALMSYHYHL